MSGWVRVCATSELLPGEMRVHWLGDLPVLVLNLDGDSYRLRDHHAKNEALRATATGTRRPLQ